MKNLKLILSILFVGLLFTSCSKDEEIPEPIVDPEEPSLEVENFIYAGLNEIYLYKADVMELADDYFASDEERNEYLASFDSPSSLFYDGLTAEQDRFSFLVDNYIELEKLFSGVSTTNGMALGLGTIGESNDVFAYVKYVMPNTSAAEQGIERGDAFMEIDGTQMTVSNYSDLLNRNTYTITLATISNNTISQTDETVTLTQAEYTENPVHIVKVLEIDGKKIGYLMYNSFTADFDDALNMAFAELKAGNVTELVLDLRYNGGGSVESAVDLSSMITGQFEGEVFMTEQWNEKYQTYFENEDPEFLINRFNPEIRTGAKINSLNLSRVYVLTTNRTASASELVINGLNPYIDVVQVGTTTTGKFQASVTLYDSPNFGRENANPNHTYAMQPLVLKSVNSVGVSDYYDGLVPDIEVAENLNNLGVLGDPSEPLLAAAIGDITGNKTKMKRMLTGRDNFRTISTEKIEDITFQKMYINKLPPTLKK